MSNDLEVYHGDSWIKGFTLTNKDGDPLNITGMTAKITVNEEKDPVDDTNELISIVGVPDADPLTGRFTFTLTGPEVGKFFYDFEVTGTGWGPRTLFKAKYTIPQDIGKA